MSSFARTFSLLVVIFSGMGFRLLQFEGAIILWTTVLFLINIKYVIKVNVFLLTISLTLLILLSLIFYFKNTELPVYMAAVIFGCYIFLLPYTKKPNLLYHDLSVLFKYFMYYTLLTLPIMIFFDRYMSDVTLGYSLYKTFFYIFWFTPIGGPDFFHQLRPNGIAWEPGIWQLFLNFNLLFSLYERRSSLHIFLSFISILCVFSTTGLFVAGCLIAIYFLFGSKKIKLSQLSTVSLPILMFLPFIIDNVVEKTTGQHMGSGMTRFSDFFTGLYLLSEYPLIGTLQENAIASNNLNLIAIKSFFWSGNFIDGAFDGYLTVPNTNGYMIFLFDWGLLIGLLLLFFTFRTRIFPDKKLNILFMILLYISMSAEPISNTTFFYSLVIFGIFKSFNRYYRGNKD